MVDLFLFSYVSSDVSPDYFTDFVHPNRPYSTWLLSVPSPSATIQGWMTSSNAWKANPVLALPHICGPILWLEPSSVMLQKWHRRVVTDRGGDNHMCRPLTSVQQWESEISQRRGHVITSGTWLLVPFMRGLVSAIQRPKRTPSPGHKPVFQVITPSPSFHGPLRPNSSGCLLLCCSPLKSEQWNHLSV